LDVVTASGLGKIESPTARTWRVMAICADWRMGIESTVLSTLDHGLQLAALTSVTLFGKAVMLLLGHRPDGPRSREPNGPPGPAPAPADRGITVCLDKWLSVTDLGTDLGAAGKYPLLRVHMRTPDRPGATLEVLDSLRETLKEMAPGSFDERDWNVWYARAVVASGNVALIQLTAKLAVDPDLRPAGRKPVSAWGQAEFSTIERRALALAAHKMSASPGRAVNDRDLPARRSADVGGDGSRARQGLRMRGVHLHVIEHALVNHLRLQRCHPLDAVSSRDLTPRGHRAVASDTDPQHVQPVKGLLPPLLARCPAEEDLIDDDPGARAGRRHDAVDPGRFQRPEVRPDAHPAIRRDGDPRVRLLHLRGQRLDERVAPERQPRIRQHGLQAPYDPGLPRAGTAVENDQLSRHGATVSRFPRRAKRPGGARSGRNGQGGGRAGRTAEGGRKELRGPGWGVTFGGLP
jgi:hypothetical protein